MRILHVVPTYLPAMRYGGPMVSVHALCRHLVALGHEVHVCTTSIDGPADLDQPVGVPVDRDGVSVWYFRADRLRRLALSSGMRAWLGQFLTRFDLLHTHGVFLWPTWFAARSARTRGVPYVMAPRGMLVPELIGQRRRLAKVGWLRLFESRNIAAADAIHFTSALELADAGRVGISLRRAAVIPNAVDAEEVRFAADETPGPESAPYLLCLGRLNWKKGLDRMLHALVNAPALRAVIAGSDEDGCRASLERLAASCGVADRVRFAGPVHGAEKWRLIRGARALVLPSHSENFGNVVLEAMAAGVPVVVSPKVGLAAAVRKSGCGTVTEAEPAQLAAALERLWHDDTLRREMGERGRKLAECEYAWPRVAAQMADLYRSILETRVASAPER